MCWTCCTTQGLDDELLQSDQIPPPLDVDEAGLPYETIAANRLSWLDSSAGDQAAYCAAPGGGDPIQLWGLPTSLAVNMGALGEVYVLRTQRAAFQEWVAGAPWAAPGQVTVVLAGDLAKEFNLLPPRYVLSHCLSPGLRAVRILRPQVVYPATQRVGGANP